jgi:hypothetical protein
MGVFLISSEHLPLGHMALSAYEEILPLIVRGGSHDSWTSGRQTGSYSKTPTGRLCCQLAINPDNTPSEVAH